MPTTTKGLYIRGLRRTAAFSLWAISLLFAIMLALRTSQSAAAEKESSGMPDYEARVNAPEFPEGLQWLNTQRPLSLRELRGKVVLLDFWTYCCINCMHVVPNLKRLEKKYARELVVIGVHSAKFTGERDTDNIRKAVLRYEIDHPVVNDRDLRVWRAYGVRAWPTLMLIDPDGKLVGYFSGERIFEPFDELIAKVIAKFDAQGRLDRRPLQLRLERQRVPASVLAFPGKVLADAASHRLFIADSNHNRIVALSLPTASVQALAGSGEAGMQDGSLAQATFNHPQGMALDDQVLYVADTENHAIRRIDWAAGSVSTVAGTGEQAGQPGLGGPGRSTPLSSPWDLVVHGGTLYIAMAGPHQIWEMDLTTNAVRPFLGSGHEGLIDGPLPAAALAQPSGITTDGSKLYFADSEASAVRAAALDPNGRVETLIGEDLFEFGDADGNRAAARLQHPLGVAYADGVLYVADTYNNKIKRISLPDAIATTFLGTGEPGLRDGETAQFDQPGGLSVAGGKLYIADTNNHTIRVADLRTRRVDTLQIEGLEKLRPRGDAPQRAVERIPYPEQAVAPGPATLTISLELPPGYKLNAQAPSAVTVTALEPDVVSVSGGSAHVFLRPQFPLRVPLTVREGQGTVRAQCIVYYCEAAKERLCYFKEANLELALRVRKGSGSQDLAAVYKLAVP